MEISIKTLKEIKNINKEIKNIKENKTDSVEIITDSFEINNDCYNLIKKESKTWFEKFFKIFENKINKFSSNVNKAIEELKLYDKDNKNEYFSFISLNIYIHF
jgi:hypothetical protein